MSTLVLSVIGDDRAGLVNALSDVVTDHGGNWEASNLEHLAGKFAGAVAVSLPEDKVESFTEALKQLTGLLDVQVTRAAEEKSAGAADQRTVSLDLVGNDRPGIVRALSGVYNRHGLSISKMATDTYDAPHVGGRIFDAKLTATVPDGTDLDQLQADLEKLANEIQVDVSLHS